MTAGKAMNYGLDEMQNTIRGGTIQQIKEKNMRAFMGDVINMMDNNKQPTMMELEKKAGQYDLSALEVIGVLEGVMKWRDMRQARMDSRIEREDKARIVKGLDKPQRKRYELAQIGLKPEEQPSIDDVIAKNLFDNGIIMRGNRVFTKNEKGGWALKEKDPKITHILKVDDDGTGHFTGFIDGEFSPEHSFKRPNIGKTTAKPEPKGPKVVDYVNGRKVTRVGGEVTVDEQIDPAEVASQGLAQDRAKRAINSQVRSLVNDLTKDPLGLPPPDSAAVISKMNVRATELAEKGMSVMQAVDRAFQESRQQDLIQDIPKYNKGWFSDNVDLIADHVRKLASTGVQREDIIKELIAKKIPEKVVMKIVNDILPKTKGIPTSPHSLTNDSAYWKNNR